MALDHSAEPEQEAQRLTVSMAGKRSLRELRKRVDLSRCTMLVLEQCWHVNDLGPLAGLTQLTTLELSTCDVTDLGPLAGLTRLTTLKLSSSVLSDLHPLAELTQLTTLSLSFCRQVSDLGPLAALTLLTTLNLDRCEQVSDLGPVAGLTHLTTLNLINCQQVQDFSPLVGLTNLTTLDLRRSAQQFNPYLPWDLQWISQVRGLSLLYERLPHLNICLM
jgi:internalin A